MNCKFTQPFHNIVARTVLFVCATILPFTLYAQQINGVTGLLSAPSAMMQRDGTVMIGGNFLNKHISPPVFPYNTYNYYLNITFLPFMEVAYSCTLFRRFENGNAGKAHNQDRNFSLRLRALKESRYLPSIVIGSTDLYTTRGSFMSQNKSNQYFGGIFGAASKHWNFGGHEIGAHISYLYGPRDDSRLSGFAAAVDFSPSFARNVMMIAEYDSANLNLGLQAVLFKHLFAQVILQNAKYVTAGLAVKIYLRRN